MRRKATPYLFIAPFYMLFLAFMVGPILFAVFIGLTNWQGLASPEFLGPENYANLLKDGTFLLSLKNTIWYALVGLCIVIPLALLLANLLNARWLVGKGLFRTIYFMPVATCALVIGICFKLIYNYDYGLLNWVLVRIGLTSIDWAGTITWFKPAVAGMIIWRWTGNTMMYFLAGLQSISAELYDAARIDGAGTRQCFRYITLPMLKPIILLVVVILTISSFQIFEEPYMLLFDAKGFGGPSDSGLSMAMYLYRVGFRFMRRGYASAIGCTLFAIIFMLTLVQTRLFGLFREDE